MSLAPALLASRLVPYSLTPLFPNSLSTFFSFSTHNLKPKPLIRFSHE